MANYIGTLYEHSFGSDFELIGCVTVVVGIVVVSANFILACYWRPYCAMRSVNQLGRRYAGCWCFRFGYF